MNLDEFLGSDVSMSAFVLIELRHAFARNVRSQSSGVVARIARFAPSSEISKMLFVEDEICHMIDDA